VAARPLETGWLPDTPVEDTLLRCFVHNQAEVNAVVAASAGGRSDRTDDVFLADAVSPVPYFNQAILARPVLAADDPGLDAVDRFFAGHSHPVTVLSIWPTPDLSSRGWSLVGHPAFVVRAPSPHGHVALADVEVRAATTADDYAVAGRVVVDGYPFDVDVDRDVESLFRSSLGERGLLVRLGILDGEPVGVGNRFVAHGVVNLCLGATLPAARRRGVWQSLVWARVDDAPDLPAVAFTSDDSRPGFIRMGFLPVTRFTMWLLPA
jgi:hypothetical protein